MTTIPKPTESILNVAERTRITFGPHTAILIDPVAGTVIFGWHSPAGYSDDPLSFTGGILQPSEAHRYNEITLPLSDLAGLEKQAKKLNIKLTREVETPEWKAAVAAAAEAAAEAEAAEIVALPALALAQLDIPRDAKSEDTWDGNLRDWRLVTNALWKAKGKSTSISAIKEKSDEEIRAMLA